MNKRHAGGFTLIELLVAMAIFSIISLTISIGLMSSSRSFVDRRTESNVQMDRRAVAYALERGLRSAGLDPLETSGAGIDQAFANQVTISNDLNLNGTLDAGEQTTFRFDAIAKTLRRLPGDGTVGPGPIVAGNLAQVTFRYLDANGDDLGVPGTAANLRDEIRTIEVNLIADGVKADADIFTRPLRLLIPCPNL
jgi:prepilin-type N-terminal cleavage/methylation domain-containing protein